MAQEPGSEPKVVAVGGKASGRRLEAEEVVLDGEDMRLVDEGQGRTSAVVVAVQAQARVPEADELV